MQGKCMFQRGDRVRVNEKPQYTRNGEPDYLEFEGGENGVVTDIRDHTNDREWDADYAIEVTLEDESNCQWLDDTSVTLIERPRTKVPSRLPTKEFRSANQVRMN